MPAQPLILITGAGGQLAEEFKLLAAQCIDLKFEFADKATFPIEDPEKGKLLMETHKPDYLINCAAYTAVDMAEDEKEKAFLINAQGTASLARLAKEFHCRFIHFSTDYVFNGKEGKPWIETDPTDPVNIYGESKRKGEELAWEVNSDAIIIRTSWVYSVFGKNFVKTMIRLMKERPSLQVVNDQKGSPTYARDLAEAVIHIIRSGKWFPGFYHFSNQGEITWFQFASAIKNNTASACEIFPVATAQFPTKAKRPSYSVMNTEKFVKTFEIQMKPWEESLTVCLSQMPA